MDSQNLREKQPLGYHCSQDVDLASVGALPSPSFLASNELTSSHQLCYLNYKMKRAFIENI